MNIQKPKGTNDLFGAQMTKREHILQIITKILNEYNYQKIDTPIFENYKLFDRSIGEQTDVVNKEMYDFLDKGNRHMALRPEGTAGVIRAYLENKLYANPIALQKYYYVGKMFRYERPGNGRMREFNQIGVEQIGPYTYINDVEVLLLAQKILNALNIDVQLKINNLGDTNERKGYIAELVKRLTLVEDRLSNDSKRRLKTNPLRILDSKEDNVEELIEMIDINDYLTIESKQYFEQIKIHLNNLGVNYIVDSKLVRGLDYYTNLVFEFVDKKTNLTILGGGRYNHLIENLGKIQMPSIGFAIGLERLEMLSKIEFEPSSVDYLIGSLDTNADSLMLQIAQTLRNNNFKVEISNATTNIKSKYNLATRINSQKIIFVGAKEVEKQKIIIKNLKTKEEEEIEVSKLNEIK